MTRAGAALPAVALSCKCARCGHVWTTRSPNPPKGCAKCKSRSWRTKAGSVPLGRKRGDK